MVVAYRTLVSALVPFGFRSYWDLVGVGHRGFGNKGLGTGLDNCKTSVPKINYLYVPIIWEHFFSHPTSLKLEWKKLPKRPYNINSAAPRSCYMDLCFFSDLTDQQTLGF